MPKRFRIGIAQDNQRLKILKLVFFIRLSVNSKHLEGVHIDDEFDFNQLVAMTEKYSGMLIYPH